MKIKSQDSHPKILVDNSKATEHASCKPCLRGHVLLAVVDGHLEDGHGGGDAVRPGLYGVQLLTILLDVCNPVYCGITIQVSCTVLQYNTIHS